MKPVDKTKPVSVLVSLQNALVPVSVTVPKTRFRRLHAYTTAVLDGLQEGVDTGEISLEELRMVLIVAAMLLDVRLCDTETGDRVLNKLLSVSEADRVQ